MIKYGKFKDLVTKNIIIIDGNHNENGARVLNEYLHTLDWRQHEIYEMKENKDHEKYKSNLKDL